MKITARQLFTCLAATAGIAALAACGDAGAPERASREPFGFEEVRKLSLPLGSAPPILDQESLAELRGNQPKIAELYRDGLTRFETIYGNGVGPAKDSPDYLDCKNAFREVGVWTDPSAVGRTEAALDELWYSLKRCREVANDWKGPAEMATFGNDLRAMTDGSMLVLAYSATVSEMPVGPQIYHDAIDSGPPPHPKS